MNWPRVSLTVRDEKVEMLLAATVWSVSSRSAEAVGALRPPAPRELLAVHVVEAVADAELVAAALNW